MTTRSASTKNSADEAAMAAAREAARKAALEAARAAREAMAAAMVALRASIEKMAEAKAKPAAAPDEIASSAVSFGPRFGSVSQRPLLEWENPVNAEQWTITSADHTDPANPVYTWEMTGEGDHTGLYSLGTVLTNNNASAPTGSSTIINNRESIDFSYFSSGYNERNAVFEVTSTDENGRISGTVKTPFRSGDRANFEFTFDPSTNVLEVSIGINFTGEPPLTDEELDRTNAAVDNYWGGMSFLDGEGRPVDVEFQIVRSDSPTAHTVNIIRNDADDRPNSAHWNLTEGSGFNTDGVIAHEVGHLLGLPDEYQDKGSTNPAVNFGDDDSIMNNAYHPNALSKPEHAQGFMALVAGITGKPSIADRLAADLLAADLFGFESEQGIVLDEVGDDVFWPFELAAALNISVEEAQILTLKYGEGQPLDETALKEMAEDGTIFYTNNDINAPIGVDLTNVSFSYGETLDLLGVNNFLLGLSDLYRFSDDGVKVDLEYILEYAEKGGVSLNMDENGVTTLTVNDLHFFGDTGAGATLAEQNIQIINNTGIQIINNTGIQIINNTGIQVDNNTGIQVDSNGLTTWGQVITPWYPQSA